MPRTYEQGCVTVVVLDERLTTDAAGEVTAAFSDAVGSHLPQIVVDLSAVRIADSAGLDCLCELNDKCLSRGGEARLAAPRPLIRDILQVTGVDKQLAVVDDVITGAGEFAR